MHCIRCQPFFCVIIVFSARHVLDSFDFSGADKPPKNALCMNDVRCMNVLFNTGIVDRVEKIQGLKHLRKLEDECRDFMMGDTPYRSANTRKRAYAIRACTYKFYTRLDLREKQLKRSIMREGLKIDFGRQMSSATDAGDDDNVDSPLNDMLIDAADLSESDSSAGSMNSLGDVLNSHSDGSASDSNDSDDEADKSNEDDAMKPPTSMVATKRRGQLQQKTAIKQLSEGASAALSAPRDKLGGKVGANVKQGGRIQYTDSDGNSSTPKPRPGALRRSVGLMDPTSAINEDKTFDGKDSVPTAINPKALNLKSSFGLDDNTGRVTRKIGAIMPTQSEQYILEFGNKFRQLAETSGVNDSAKSVRIVNALEDILGRVWMKARHLAIIVSYFTVGVAEKTTFFGTYRVELVVTLYSRVVDPYHIDIVLRNLTPLEVACVTCRLGLLNIYNPLKPEGFVTLDLSIREERVVAKMIAALSVTEPGENFINPAFRWEWEFDDVPGWTLLSTWMSEEGMPHRCLFPPLRRGDLLYAVNIVMPCGNNVCVYHV